MALVYQVMAQQTIAPTSCTLAFGAGRSKSKGEKLVATYLLDNPNETLEGTWKPQKSYTWPVTYRVHLCKQEAEGRNEDKLIIANFLEFSNRFRLHLCFKDSVFPF